MLCAAHFAESAEAGATIRARSTGHLEASTSGRAETDWRQPNRLVWHSGATDGGSGHSERSRRVNRSLMVACAFVAASLVISAPVPAQDPYEFRFAFGSYCP